MAGVLPALVSFVRHDLPGNPVAAYYATDYISESKTIPNAYAPSTPVDGNLLRAPRRLFNNSNFYSKLNSVITDASVTANDGSDDASTIVGTGNWQLHSVAGGGSIPAGTYTVACWVKSNSGSSEVFAFSGDNTATRSSTKTATTAWQRFSYTFTRGASFDPTQVYLLSSDGSTSANLQICDFKLYSGSDAGEEYPLSGHLTLGLNTGDTKVTSGAGYVDLSTGGWGTAQFQSSKVFNGGTFICIASKVSAGSSYQAFLSDANSYTGLTAFFELSNAPKFFIGSSSSLSNAAGLWRPLGLGYFAFVCQYDGANNQIWINGTKVSNAASALGAAHSAKDFLVGIVNSSSLSCGYKINSIAFWDSPLSQSSVNNAISYMSGRAVSAGLTMASERILICEGDSITGGYSTAYPYVATYSPGVMGANYAISGSTISSISSRASVIDAIWPSDIATTTKKYIFSLLIGANDLTAYSAATVTSTYIPLLQSYLTSRRAAGAGNIKIVLCTVTPRTDSTFNTNRAVLNSWITTSAVSGGWADAIADFAGDATIGADASASNATYYRDGLHPTDAGFAVMAPIFASAVGSI